MHNWNNNIRLLLFCLCFFFPFISITTPWLWTAAEERCPFYGGHKGSAAAGGSAAVRDREPGQQYTQTAHRYTRTCTQVAPLSSTPGQRSLQLGSGHWVGGWLTNPSNRGRRPITCQRGGLHRRLNSGQNIDSLLVKDCNSPGTWCTHLKINKDVKIDHKLAAVHWVRQLSQCAIWSGPSLYC